jgi:ribosomal protein S6
LIFFEAPSTGLVEINRENGFHEDLLRSMIITAESVPEEISFKQLVQV